MNDLSYLPVSACRFKRQISDKPQSTVSRKPAKPQNIVQYAKNSPVFGVKIKCRAVLIYSFSKYTSTPAALSFRTVVRVSTVFRANRLTDFVRIRSIFPSRASCTMRLNRKRSIIPRYRKAVVLSTHTVENHDLISSDQGSRSST